MRPKAYILNVDYPWIDQNGKKIRKLRCRAYGYTTTNLSLSPLTSDILIAAAQTRRQARHLATALGFYVCKQDPIKRYYRKLRKHL